MERQTLSAKKQAILKNENFRTENKMPKRNNSMFGFNSRDDRTN